MLFLVFKSNGERFDKAPSIICRIEQVKAAHDGLIALVDQLCESSDVARIAEVLLNELQNTLVDNLTGNPFQLKCEHFV
jgi:hypothetical protein